jgi:hypothetical protein
VQERNQQLPTYFTRPLADGGTLTIDGSTIPDPETGQPIPAATLRLPAWRLRDLAGTLSFWSATAAALASHADETDLGQVLALGAALLTPAPMAY